MGAEADTARHRFARRLRGGLYTCIVALSAILTVDLAAKAQENAVMQPGDAAVTAFSGARQIGEVPPGSSPADVTFINTNGASLQVFDLSGPGAAPDGQVFTAPVKYRVNAGEIGQVFAIALDRASGSEGDSPDIYAGQTSAFGLQLVLPDADGDGRPERTKKGHPDAEWMAGQFGPEGGPGAIWKVDGETGAVSLFATVPNNSGPGLGDIVFDPATHQFFVSNLDDGLIYRLDRTGAVRDSFDHGQAGRTAAGLAPIADDGAKADIKSPAFDSEDPATWGFTQPERRVWGLGLRAGRLYYAVADGPSIWSVSINLDGTFGEDPRLEIEVSGTPANHPISDIAFDSADYMYIAQRGGIKGSYDYSVFADSKQSVLWRFKREIPDDPETPGIWVPIPDEYAVGFPPDYRNTSGGVALGYGYDESGVTRRGACDVFVWSTGDSLRDNAEYADGLEAGGPTVIHGLQGNDRSLIRPDNEPPFAAYFVDYDGKSDDPENQGHAGDVEIWQPCDPKADFGSYAPAPDLPFVEAPPAYFPPGEWPPEWIPPEGWPEDDFNLALHKEALPGACVAGGLGFVCDYVVRVTNLGPAPYLGPIVVNDRLPADPAGAVMTFANVPPWVCFAISPTEHQCMFPPTLLLPGDSVDLRVTVDLPVAAPVCHLDNAAYIVWPAGFGDANPADDFDWATAIIPAAHCPPPLGEKTNLKIEKEPWKPVCTDKFAHFECDYAVVVRNAGPGTYSGKIKVDEFVPAGTTAVFFAGPNWTCSAAAPYSCEHDPVVLAPNQVRSFGVRLRVPKNLAGPLACEATNKVKIAEAVGGTDQNTDPTDDEAEATAILPGNLADCPGLPPLSNLKLFKTRPADKCFVSDGNWVCEFKLKVQNFGAPYTSTLQIADALPFGTPPGATVSFTAPAGWNCGGPVLFPNLYQCSSDNPNLPHLGSAEIIATVKVPVAAGVPCAVTNNALITKAAGGTLLNSFAGDDMSSATATFAPVWPPGGDPAICVAPAMGGPEPPIKTPEGKETNLTITKTAGPSQATATGQNTMFTITVTNEGPGAHAGPIVVRDTLFDGETVEPSNGSWSAPWTCEGQSAAGHPEQGICTHPAIELDPGESVVLKLEIEAPNSFVAPSGAQVRCGYKNSAEILKPAGGTPQNTNAGDDTATAEVAFAPFEKHGQKFCAPGLTTPPPACPQGWSHTPVPGKCCPPGSGWDGERCKRDVTPPEETPPDEAPPPLCVPGPNELRTAQGKCVCKQGYERDQRGNCVKIVVVPCVPGPNEVLTPLGKCVCKSGYERDKRGNCVKPEPQCVPGPNETRDSKGRCVCKTGYERDKRGNCVKPANPAEECRRKGWSWVDGRCLNPADLCKAKGWRWIDGRCVAPPNPAEECRKKGWRWDGKRCLPPTDPAAECKKKGWIWNAKRKTCTPPPNPAEECKKKGWRWDGKRCLPPLKPLDTLKPIKPEIKPIKPEIKPIDPAVLCKAKGWIWDGKSCKAPPSPSTVR